jgi:hypothetical protein
MTKKKCIGAINIPLDRETESELRSYVIERKKSEPHICLADVVRVFIRDGLKSAKSLTK